MSNNNEPVAWSIQWHGENRPDGHWTYEDKHTAEICLAGCGSKGVVVPLYRSPTLTDAEREALERNLKHANGRWLMHVSEQDQATIGGLLERTK